MADGRYLARQEDGERVLVVETLGAPPPLRRRRRRPTEAEPGAAPAPLPLTRITVARAHEPFASGDDAGSWLAETLADEDSTDAALAEALSLLNRALHVHAVASAGKLSPELRAEDAAAVRIGIGSGEEVSAGRYAVAQEIDARAPARSPRRRREEALRPQERAAAVLAGRERLDTCETLLLRARADLDANRRPEAALQLQIGLEALLVELDGALTDPGHAEDMAQLQARRTEASAAANAALHGDLSPHQLNSVRELLDICERVLRRRRILRA